MGDGGGVRRIEITERETPVFGGAEFGAVGAYERLHGTAFCELDPAHALNAGIVNLDKAPRNARGHVEYQVDFRILKPIDLDRGNGWLVYDVPNRGNQPVMPRLNGAPEGGHPQTAGNGFLMRHGFTVVWSAWQGDVPPGADRLVARFPIATGADGPLTGMVREEFIAEATGLLGDANIQEVSEDRFIGTLIYPVADLHAAEATLTVRQREADPRATPQGLAWRLIDDRHVEITRPTAPGFDRGAIYEFIYRARDPMVMGIGFAAIRDIVAFLRHATHDAAGNANPLAPRRAAHPPRAGFRNIAKRPRAARSVVLWVQPGPRRAQGVRCDAAGGRRIAADLCELGLRAARALFEAARGSFLRRRSVPVQLSHADRSDQRPHGRHSATCTRRRRVPEGDASGYRERCLAGTQFAGGHRHRRRRYRHAGRRARLSGKRRAACRASAAWRSRSRSCRAIRLAMARSCGRC